MGGGLLGQKLDKFLSLLGFEVVEEDNSDEKVVSPKKENNNELNWYNRKLSKRREQKGIQAITGVKNTLANSNAKIVICRPTSLEQVYSAADNLRENCSAIVDLTELSAEQAQRGLDYFSGVVFAIGGKASRIGSGIFLFVPINVLIKGAVDTNITGVVDSEINETQTQVFSSEKVKQFFKEISA